MSAFLAELASDEITEDEDDNMALPKTEAELATLIENAKADAVASIQQPDTAKIAADAVKVDRERREGILALDEAKDRSKLANTLANGDYTVEQAKVLLGAAAVEKTETAAPTGSALDKVMETVGGAGVRAVDQDGEGDESDKPTVASKILAFVPAAKQISK